ncbi:MAG: hypothetical protein QXU74_00035 [Candidatus Aenigmatarchaeota archaeon]
MKKWLVFIFLTLFLLPSVGFAVDCDYDCRHRGGIGKCTGWAYSSCPSDYIEGKGSCNGWWVFTPKCCCRPVITVSHSPAQVTDKDEVTYTAKLLVDMPITQLSIIVKSDAGSGTNSCTSSECYLTAGPYKAGTTVIYQAIVNPVMGGAIFTEEKSFIVGATKECDRNKWNECNVDCTNKCGILKGTERNECGEERECGKNCGSCPSGYECRNNRCEKIGEEAPITTCARSNPSISVNPSSYTATAGTEKEYEVTVKNNNQNCKDSVFILEASCPPGWDCSWSPSSLTISSGSSAKSTLKVRSSAKELPVLFRIKIVVSTRVGLSFYKAPTYVDYTILSTQQPSPVGGEGCTGSISLTLSPNPAQTNSRVTASVSGLSNCDGKEAYVLVPLTISLPVTPGISISISIPSTYKLVCKCTISGSGCSCSFTAPSDPISFLVTAVVDKNDNNIWDSGESVLSTLNIQLPLCPYFCLTTEECGYRSGSHETGYGCQEGKICCKTILEASHSPSNPTISDVVIIKATSSSTMEKIEIFVDNNWKKTCTSTNECSYSSQFVEGSHTYEAKASIWPKYYSSGVKSFTVQVAQDNPPLIAITKPIGKETLPIKLKFMVYDKESGVDKSSLAYRLDSGSWTSISSTSCTGSCEKVWPHSCTCEVLVQASLGQHTLAVRARDTKGNEGSATTIFTAEAPTCSGSVVLNLPASTLPSQEVTASVSGLSNCYEKTAYVLSEPTKDLVCSCPVSGSGCSCSFTAPSSLGTYTYFARVDINGNQNYEDPGEISSNVVMKVVQYCSDTDGGNKPLAKGTITSTIAGDTRDTDSCGYDNVQLVEWFCESTGLASNTVINCNNYCKSLGYSSGSCSDGACSCTSGETTTTLPSCSGYREQISCVSANCYWCDGKCKSDPCTTTTTLPPYTPCPSGYFCTSSNLACQQTCQQQGMVYDVLYRENPCDTEGHHHCCKCVTPPSQSCSNHADCSKACTDKCPALAYGCCYGCKLGQCINGKCQCVDAVSYCSGTPNYQVGDRCVSTGGILSSLWDFIKSIFGIQ